MNKKINFFKETLDLKALQKGESKNDLYKNLFPELYWILPKGTKFKQIPTYNQRPKPKSKFIRDSDYSLIHTINKTIFKLGELIENTPKTFSKLGEDDIRNIILVMLNFKLRFGSFGEVFSKNGKTDISVIDGKKIIYKGECKFWGGEKKFKSTYKQLLGYNTWKNQNCSLIIFDRSPTAKAFDSIKKILLKNSNFIVSKKSKKGLIYFYDSSEQKNCCVIYFHIPIK